MITVNMVIIVNLIKSNDNKKQLNNKKNNTSTNVCHNKCKNNN